MAESREGAPRSAQGIDYRVQFHPAPEPMLRSCFERATMAVALIIATTCSPGWDTLVQRVNALRVAAIRVPPMRSVQRGIPRTCLLAALSGSLAVFTLDAFAGWVAVGSNGQGNTYADPATVPSKSGR